MVLWFGVFLFRYSSTDYSAIRPFLRVSVAWGWGGGGGEGNAGCCQGVAAAERKGSTARRSGRGVWRCRRQYPSIAGACGSGGPGQPGDLAGRPEGGISAGTGERGARHIRHGLVCPGAGGKR